MYFAFSGLANIATDKINAIVISFFMAGPFVEVT